MKGSQNATPHWQPKPCRKWPTRPTCAKPQAKRLMATRYRSRPWFSRSDLVLVQALARARMEADWPALRIHPGDLDWWVVGAYGASPSLEERVRLWFAAETASEDEPGALRAFAWRNHSGQTDFEIASDDAEEVDALIGEIMAWSEASRPIKVWASLGEPATASLTALGLRRTPDAAFVYLTGDISVTDRWEPAALPHGLAFQTMADGLVESRVVCSRAAFPHSTMTAERYRQTFEANMYRPELDLLI